MLSAEQRNEMTRHGSRLFSPDESSRVATELVREIPRGHVLHGKTFTPVGQGPDHPDDVLIQLEAENAFAFVYLTWSIESDNDRPFTKVYGSLAAALEDA